jgi:hypothetical protein
VEAKTPGWDVQKISGLVWGWPHIFWNIPLTPGPYPWKPLSEWITEHLHRCRWALYTWASNYWVHDPAKVFLNQSLVIYFFPTAPIKLKLGMQIDGRLHQLT